MQPPESTRLSSVFTKDLRGPQGSIFKKHFPCIYQHCLDGMPEKYKVYPKGGNYFSHYPIVTTTSLKSMRIKDRGEDRDHAIWKGLVTALDGRTLRALTHLGVALAKGGWVWKESLELCIQAQCHPPVLWAPEPAILSEPQCPWEGWSLQQPFLLSVNDAWA